MGNNKILVVALLLITVSSFGFGGWMFFSKDKTPTKKAHLVIKSSSHTDKKVTIAEEKSKIDIVNFWDQGYIRSPFYSPAAEKQKKIFIQGIVKNAYSKDYKAMINSKLVRVGQSIEGYEILEINASSVIAKNLKTQNKVTLKVFE